MNLHPYLFFDGRCEEAIEFYRRTVGVEGIEMIRFGQAPDPSMVPPGAGENVMHMRCRIAGTEVFASDGRCQGRPNFQGFALSLTVADAMEAEKVFGQLSEGGTVQMPLAQTFFSPSFGMVADKFGITWMVYVAARSPT